MAYKVTNIKHAGVIAVFLLMIPRNCNVNYTYILEKSNKENGSNVLCILMCTSTISLNHN